MKQWIRVIMVLMFIGWLQQLCVSQYHYSLIISDAGSGIDTLEFGYSHGATYCIDPELGEYGLPPPPPADEFDVRFIDNRSGAGACLDQGINKNFYGFNISGAKDTFRVAFQTDWRLHPFTVRWSGPFDYLSSASLKYTHPDDGPVIIDMLSYNSCQIPLGSPDIPSFRIIVNHNIICCNDPPPVLSQSRTDSITEHSTKLICSLQVINYCESWFEWGTTASYGNKTQRNYATGITLVQTLSDLTASTTYHFSSIAVNCSGIDTSADQTFRTLDPVGVPDNKSLPTTFSLEQNYPNPFNPSTVISFRLYYAESV